MDRGIYSAASGGLLNERRIQVVSNNLANANTAGFKNERLVTEAQSFQETLSSTLQNISPRAEKDHDRTPGVVNTRTVTDFAVGPVSETGNPLNVALQEQNHFFVVTTPEGETYSRAGNFTLNADGTLVTPDGMPVSGEGGPITLPQGDVQITGAGAVVVGGEQIARLRVVAIEDLTKLKRVEGTRFALDGGGQVSDVSPNLIPRSLEMANISVVESMIELVAASRSFEAYTKTVRTIDELNEQAIRTSQTTG